MSLHRTQCPKHVKTFVPYRLEITATSNGDIIFEESSYRNEEFSLSVIFHLLIKSQNKKYI